RAGSALVTGVLTRVREQKAPKYRALAESQASLDRAGASSNNEPIGIPRDKNPFPRSVSRMMRGFLVSIVTLVVAGPALAAADIETCRDNQAEAAARLTACNAAVADDKVTGKPKAFANWYIGDSLLKKRAYDEINIALSLNTGTNRYTNLLNLGRVQTLRKQYESALTYFAEGKPLNPGGWQIPNYRCITYTEMGRLNEALADCNEVLAQ